MTEKKLAKAQASETVNIGYPSVQIPGLTTDKKFNYHKTIKDCRYYYENDPIAGTVVNRLVEIAVTNLKNRRKSKQNKTPIDNETIAYYDATAMRLKAFLKHCALEYVLHGMMLPEFTTIRKMGNRASEYLGRTRYQFPDKLWSRNPDNIVLKKLPSGADRLVYLKIPGEEINLVKTKGKPDRQNDYQFLVNNYPDYVAAISAGKKEFLLEDIHPIYRKLTSYNDYPLPYLKNALSSFAHKEHLKTMDKSIASRVIEAIRQIKVGSDEFPADDDDLKAEQAAFIAYGSNGERIFNYFTNHTIDIKWSYPPMDALLSQNKFTEPNLEIFFALGFPRIWVNGETERSNAADNSTASVGPMATLNDIRDSLLEWIVWFYEQLAEINDFSRVPEPYFSPINLADVANLIQYAEKFMLGGAISRDDIAQFYGQDYESVLEQRRVEKEQEEKLNPTPEPEPVLVDENGNPAAPKTAKPIIGKGNAPKDADSDGSTEEE